MVPDDLPWAALSVTERCSIATVSTDPAVCWDPSLWRRHARRAKPWASVRRTLRQCCIAVAIWVVAAVTIGYAQQPSGDVPAPGEQGHVMHGRVLADDSGNPLRNARVAVESDSNPPPVVTDSEGRFAIAAAPQRAQTLSVSRTGYATTRVPLSDGAEIRLPKSAAIAGWVIDGYGDPMPLAEVVVERRTRMGGHVQSEPQAWAETDDTGAYRVFGLSAGDYVVGFAGARMIMPGSPPPMPHRPAVEYYPDASRADEAQVFVVGAGTEVTGINFTLPFTLPTPSVTEPSSSSARPGALGEIRGRVARADGRPVRFARVQLSSVERVFSPIFAPLDNDGIYAFVDVSPGRYLITVTNGAFPTTTFGQRRASDRGDLVTVTAGTVADHIDIAVPRTSAIMGRIVDEYGDPVENVRVHVEQVRWSTGRRRLVPPVIGVPSRQTDDLGRFRIFDLPPGRYVLDADGGEPNVGQVNDVPGYVRTYWPGTPLVADTQAVEVADGEDVLNLEFSLARGRAARIAGRVFTADGQPLDGVVNLSASDRSGAIAAAKPVRMRTEDGSFQFDHLPPGEYVVQAAISRESPSIEGQFGEQFVTVDGADVDDVVIHMSAGSSVAGRVTFEGDVPPSDATDVELSPVPSDVDFVSLAGDPIARAEIHDDWSFEMQGLNGPRRLTLLHAPEGWMLKAIYLGGVDITDVPLPFGTTAQSMSDVEVVLTNHITEIVGGVTDERGRPFSDAGVVVFPTERTLWYATSRFIGSADVAEDGTFTVRGLPPGDYYVAAAVKRDTSDLNDAIENPDFLQTLAVHAARITVIDGHRATVVVRVSDQ
jgi:hypothetical protein